MAATYLLRKHQRSLEAIDKPEAVEARRTAMEASGRAKDERQRRFKIITPDNFEDANSFYLRRFEFWKKKLAQQPNAPKG